MNSTTSETYCNTQIINVLPESVQNQLSEAWTEEIKLYPQTIEDHFKSRVLRLNQEKIQYACQISGCKPNLAKAISDSIISHYRGLVQKQIQLAFLDPLEKYSIYTTNEKFIELLTKKLAEYEFTKKRNIFDFEIGLSLIEHTRPMIVLVGGTSGSGKSTVSSLLAARFGVSTVLSTDSIRHIMRNFMLTEECPILFASTYEAGNKIKLEEGTSEKRRVVMGFKQQASAVQEKLDNIIQGFYNRGESIIMEGVHLTPDFMASMITKYNNCVPFLVYIRSENKHRERFAVRSKYMTLEKKHNKYIQHFANIRDIQKHLTKKADEYLIPKVNNSNIDKSVGIIHRTVIRCLRRIAMGENLFDPEKKNGLKVYLQFNEVTKNIWSSDTAMQYINVKMSKANKAANVERFLFKDNDDVANLNTNIETQEVLYQNAEAEAEAEAEEDQGDSEGKEGEKDDEIEASQIDVEQDEISKIDPQFKYKEDMLLFNEDSYANARSQLNAISKKKPSEKLVGSDKEEKNGKKNVTSEQQQKDFRLAPPKVSSLKHEEEKSIDDVLIEEGQETKTKLQDASPTFIKPIPRKSIDFIPVHSVDTPTSRQNKNQMKFRELEEVLVEKRSVSLKGPLTQYNLKRIKKFVDYYNKRHNDSFVKLYPQNERYLIYKHNRSEAVPPQLGTSDISDMSGKTLLLKNVKRRAEAERRNTAKFTESGTSDGEVEGSDDETSMISEEKYSNLSGSMDANFHLTGRHHLSDNQDFSDDFESVAKLDEDDRSEGRTSLEIVESANSISEQSEEDVEDEEDVIMDRPPKLIK